MTQMWSSASPDIEEQITNALLSIFGQLLAAALPGDPLGLVTLQLAPLQQDPTQVAPYLIFSLDPDKPSRPMTHEECKQYGDIEIGGPVNYLYFYKATVGTPIVTTRAACAAQLGNLTSRVVQLLVQHYDLSGVLAPGGLQAADGSKRIEAANRSLIDKMESGKLKGGEQTWFGEGCVEWHYPVAWYTLSQVSFS